MENVLRRKDIMVKDGVKYEREVLYIPSKAKLNKIKTFLSGHKYWVTKCPNILKKGNWRKVIE